MESSPHKWWYNHHYKVTNVYPDPKFPVASPMTWPGDLLRALSPCFGSVTELFHFAQCLPKEVAFMGPVCALPPLLIVIHSVG